jgi:hypothetical protein
MMTTDSWSNDGGRVTVTITKELSTDTTPTEAKEAWLLHHWKRGGGLPILIVTCDEQDKNEQSKRVIYPVCMEETLMRTASEVESSTLSYYVSKPGPFFADLVPNSHMARVTFSSENEMSWDVEFETTRFRSLYESITKFTVGVAARTVQEALRPSRLLTVTSTLLLPPEKQANTLLDDVSQQVLGFFWARGGGLPIPPPIPYGKVLRQGDGKARKKLLRIPPLITESIVSIHGTDEESTINIVYQLENPGWSTFPFLLHTHLGKIKLVKLKPATDDDLMDAVDLVWQVEIRSFPILAPVIETLVEMTVTTIVRNLLVHITEPKAFISLKSTQEKTSSFASISKDSWLGGVLDARMEDKRSTWEQTIALFTPWTWGRSSNTDSITFDWSEGRMK